MYWTRGIFIQILFFSLWGTLSGQPFPCDGRLILAAVQNNTSTYNITFGPFGAVYYEPITVFLDEQFDALGFNPKDNFIYGVQSTTNAIARLQSEGSYELLSSENQVSTFAGDCSPDGLYFCHDNDLNQILVFEVVNNFQQVNQIDLFWSPFSPNSGTFTTRLDDFAIDPNNPNIAYAFHGNSSQDEYEPESTQGKLVSINLDFTDPDVGMVTPIATIPENVILKLESLFFTAGGQLFGYGPYTLGPIVASRLISINPFTGEANVEGISSPQSTISDGCSCPYNLTFTNNPTPNFVTCSDSELTYTLTINNQSNEELPNLLLTNTIPEGMIISDISGNFDGTISPGTGVGTRIIDITNLNIPPRALIVINIETNIIDIPIGLTANKANLSNLPPLFGGNLSSDDPNTIGYVGDSTRFYSDPRNIEDVELTIIPPSNCLDPNDAQVIISSPQLLSNQSYQIKLINQEWDEFDLNILVNNENTFVLDSMTVGEYQLAEVTPENSECSFKWRDESILIEPPNEQLQVTAESNSPICEGVPLILGGTIAPSGTVTWTGPEGLIASEINTTIDSSILEQSGIYEMIATYGACEQIRELEIFIAPDIEAEITGKSAYCERESMHLAASGIGEQLTFEWLGPDNLASTDSSINISSMSLKNEGIYQVVIDNSYCLDTANAFISMLPSPTIILPYKIETDFCQPVQIKPEITGDHDVNYSWTPNSGLNCYDCSAPELQVPFSPRYRLTVVNDYLCADTAAVRTALSKENLIYVPNVFSPNFDGFNDIFQMFPSCGVSKIKNLKIVDRWGAIIYSKNNVDHFDPQHFWDGFVKDKIGTADVYMWQVEIELVDGSTQKLFGDVSLIR